MHALSEKLLILVAPLRFVASSAVNPRENSYKPHNYVHQKIIQFIGYIFVADS